MTTSGQDQLNFINGWPKLAMLFVAFALGGMVVGVLGMVAQSFDLSPAQTFLSGFFFSVGYVLLQALSAMPCGT